MSAAIKSSVNAAPAERSELTEDDIVWAIRERALGGLSVAWQEFGDEGLVRAARDIYGSWPAALLCAGVPVEELPQCKATSAVAVLVARQLLARGLETETALTEAGHGRWVRECEKFFGSWERALVRARAHPLEHPVMQVRLPGPAPRTKHREPQALPAGRGPVSLEQAAGAAGRSLGAVYSALRIGKLKATRGGLTRSSVERWIEGLGVAAGPDWLRPSEAARQAECTDTLIEKAFREGKLAGKRTSAGRVLIARASFETWLAERDPVQEQEGLTVLQVAEMTGLARATIYKAVTRGELAAVKVRRPGEKAPGYVILPGALPAWVAERQARYDRQRGLQGERLTVKQAAERFGCSASLLQKAIAQERLPAELAPSKTGAFVYVVGEEDVRRLFEPS